MNRSTLIEPYNFSSKLRHEFVRRSWFHQAVWVMKVVDPKREDAHCIMIKTAYSICAFFTR
jgi:hypothetical protein